MTFRGKPNLGLSKEMSFIYEREATLRGEGESMAIAGSNKKSSMYKVEPYFFNRAVYLCTLLKYIVIDIKSLHINEDSIAIRYIELAKAVAPNSKVTCWNIEPRHVVNTFSHPFRCEKWQAELDRRKALVI